MSAPLDTCGPPGTLRVLSGWNFREVAPEMLSPLSWSLVGFGMEQGFRDIAGLFGRDDPDPLPRFVASLSFRPYHVISAIEDLVERLPWMRVEDPWRCLLGGDRPLPPPPARRSRPWTVARGSVAEARLALKSGRDGGAVGARVSAAETAVLRGRSGGAFARHAAFTEAVDASRASWRLHAQTTSTLIGAVALLSRVAEAYLGPEGAAELVLAAARRTDESGWSSASPGLLDDPGDGSLGTYEVMAGTPPFLDDRSTSTASDAAPAGPTVLPLATAGLSGRVLHGVVQGVQVAVGERERSKNLGLRSLFAVRQCLGWLDQDREAVGFLSPEELYRGDVGAPVWEPRAESFAACRDEVHAVDLIQDGTLTMPLVRAERPAPPALTLSGVGVAPGCARGVVADRGATSGAVLWGDRVEARDVMSIVPAAVVTRYGSPLSHVAIVCRELGIPMVARVEEPCPGGASVVVDGDAGTVAVG